MKNLQRNCKDCPLARALEVQIDSAQQHLGKALGYLRAQFPKGHAPTGLPKFCRSEKK
jgi:hypothetical protein